MAAYSFTLRTPLSRLAAAKIDNIRNIFDVCRGSDWPPCSCHPLPQAGTRIGIGRATAEGIGPPRLILAPPLDLTPTWEKALPE